MIDSFKEVQIGNKADNAGGGENKNKTVGEAALGTSDDVWIGRLDTFESVKTLAKDWFFEKEGEAITTVFDA